jgi:DNA topoisomerase-3
MSRRLVIAEKPSVALDYAKALGPYETKEKGSWYETSQYVITFAVGHLLELAEPETYNPDWKRWSLKHLPMVPETFQYKARDGRANTRLKVLKKLAKKKDIVGIINGCDAGREGEHIFRTIYGYLGLSIPVHRLWLNSMTTRAIKKAFAEMKPGESFDGLADSAASRAESDWLIGMNATRALTRRLKSFNYQGAWSVGRVQTPTLSMIVDRELQIQKHRPESYWEITGTFAAPDHTYEGLLVLNDARDKSHKSRIFEKDQADALVATVVGASHIEAEEARKRVKERPPLPFDLTSLQRATGLTAKRTQDIAQALYERHKVLSYPRTDSRYLTQDMLVELDLKLDMLGRHPSFGPVVSTIRGHGAQNIGLVFNDERVTDHHAIIPVAVPSAGQLNDVEARVYRMVVSQFLASLMEPAEWENVNRTTTIVADSNLVFKSKGKMLVKQGWQMAMGKEVGHGSSLTPLQSSPQSVRLAEHELLESQTKPPGRFTDAGILSRMENCGRDVDDEQLSEALRERGLGTPATRADTIERLIGRSYLAREGRSLRATAKALRLLEVVTRANVQRLSSVELTGDMESKLRSVENGTISRADYMIEVISNAKSIVEHLVGFDMEEMYGDLDSVGDCPDGSGASVWETAWGYATRDDSTQPFFIWKDVGGHVVSPDEMSTLLTEGRLGPVTLYPRMNPKGQGYEAHLVMGRVADEDYAKLTVGKSGNKPSRWRVSIEPVSGGANTVATGEENVVGPFLTMDDGLEIIETNLRYVDKETLESGDRPKAVLPKEVCKRPITPEEATVYFNEGRTELLTSFVSKRGRFFKAHLIRKPNGRHGFEFQPRGSANKAASKSASDDKSKAETPS